MGERARRGRDGWLEGDRDLIGEVVIEVRNKGYCREVK